MTKKPIQEEWRKIGEEGDEAPMEKWAWGGSDIYCLIPKGIIEKARKEERERIVKEIEKEVNFEFLEKRLRFEGSKNPEREIALVDAQEWIKRILSDLTHPID